MQQTYERDEVTPLKHSMLLVKSGRDQFGTPYWEFQDSSGETKGRGGYVRIRKGVGLLTEFVEMFLVEEEPPKKKRKAVSVDASHKRPKNVHNRLSLGPGKHSKSHKLSQGRSRSSSTSTSRKAGSSVRTISPKSPVPSASAFENMDASYLQTSGYLPADATEEQISMAAASMIRSHSMSGDLQPDPIAPKEELFPGNIITVTELNKKNPLNYAQVSVLADDILKNLEFDALHNKFHSILSPEIIEKESEVGGKLGELDSCEIEAGETKGEVLQNLAEFLFSCIIEKESEVGGKLGELDSCEIEAGETKGEVLQNLAEFLFSCIIEKESEVGGKLGELDSCEIEAGETKGEVLQNLAEFLFSCIIPKESEVGGKLGELDSCEIEAGETKGEVLQNLAEFLFSCIIPKESEVGGKLGELDSCEIEAGETKGEVLQNLAEFLFSCVMFNAVLENACSEMGAGMSAMDRSSRNAGEMLDRLTLAYNRTLHASMPIETISGA
ncbi:uncharacterized protein LOC103832085 [Brassica rapa]|uniref:uncharacterized protein LOC103832085 n=1 Tax=Brassica campestris TaxID=3711 RepID=UPI00142E8A30|nr:uncharacterized protein LOC103832085 [Brassica rapa]